jgi:hypothetical protein
MATVILTVGLAFIGYLATCLNGLRLAQRRLKSEQASLLGHTAGPGRRRGFLTRR